MAFTLTHIYIPIHRFAGRVQQEREKPTPSKHSTKTTHTTTHAYADNRMHTHTQTCALLTWDRLAMANFDVVWTPNCQRNAGIVRPHRDAFKRVVPLANRASFADTEKVNYLFFAAPSIMHCLLTVGHIKRIEDNNNNEKFTKVQIEASFTNHLLTAHHFV